MVGYQLNPLVFKGSPIDLLESVYRVESLKQSTPCHLTTYMGLSSMVLFTTIDESVYSNDFPNPELENYI